MDVERSLCDDAEDCKSSAARRLREGEGECAAELVAVPISAYGETAQACLNLHEEPLLQP